MLHQKKWGLILVSFFVLLSGFLRAQSITYNVGNGTIVNNDFDYPSPYGNYYWGARHQFLVTAAELQALGATSGNITGIGFDVVNAVGVPLSGFEIKIGTTSITDLQGWQTGLTSVFSAASYSETAGWNIHNFPVPFLWDGSSNIIVETCFNNTSFTINAGVNQSITSFNSSIFFRADAAGVCSNNGLSVGAPTTQRPNIAFLINSNVPCVDPPTPGQALASISSACPSEIVSLSLFGNSIGLGQTYQWQSSPDNTTWTDIPGATNGNYATTITADTYFRCILTCGNGTANSASVMVQAGQWFDCYCTAGSLQCDEYVADVQVGAFSNPSTCGIGGYTDYSSLTIPMQIGVDNTISIINGVTIYPQDVCAVWIDWNRDGAFDPATEALSVSGTPGAGPYTAIANPPLSVAPGNTTMRIRIAYNEPLNPCGLADWGEVEDYTVNLLPPPPCATPSGLNLASGGSVTSTIDWADISNAASGYLVRYKLVSDPTTVSTWANPTIVPVSQILLTGLTPNSQYEIQVAADCAVDGQSSFSASFIFGTNCPNTDCPSGAISENEVCGADNNGGCNMPVPSYVPINCGDKVCGFSWADGGTRDTDWFTFTLTQPSTVTWSIQSDFPALIGFVDASQGCAAAQFFNLTTSPGECSGASTVDNLPAGTWWVFVSPFTFNGYPCGSGKNAYWAELTCAPLVTAANDDCANAISLNQNTSCQPTQGSVTNATQSLAGCVGTANDDVWYSFVATTPDVVVEVDGAGQFDAVVQVFDACGGNSLGCSNSAGPGQAETAVLSGLAVGQTYYFRVYDFGLGIPSIPNFDVCVYDAPPTFTITTPIITTCNGFFYDSGIGADYQNNEVYTSTIYPAVAGNVIQAAFSGFSVENNFDFLSIYDGTSTAAPLIGTYTNTNSPGIVTATNIDGALTFRFTSDISVTDAGWLAEISCISPTAVPNCVTNILPVNGATGQSTLVNLSWQAGSGAIPTAYDVYFGTTANPPLASANQTSTNYSPGTLTANTTYFWKVIAKNANGDAVGCNEYSFTTGSNAFIIMGSTVSASTCSAVFYDSGINGNYQNFENSVVTITPDQANNLVQLDFSLFNLENNFDFLSIYDGLTTAAPLIGTYTGTNSPGIVNATNPDGALTISFTSDDIVALSGWQAAVSCITSQSPPTCATNLSPANLAVNVNPFVTLSWSAGSGVPPTGYDVYFGAAPNPPLVSANQANTTYNPGALLTSTTYYWKVVPKNASGDATGCSEVSFTTASGLVYCAAGATTCDEFISGVTVGTINNSTSCGLVNGYSDYTTISTPMSQGLSYPITVNNGPPVYTADQCGVWVDWNQDGDFYDAGEAAIITNTPGTGPYNGVISVPPTASLGNTRMRVRITFIGAVDPCGVTQYGEVEDYTIQVTPAPSCPYPFSYNVTNLTTVSADLNWSAVAGAVSYNVRYKAVADPATVPTWANPTAVAAPTTTLSISGLTPGTEYEYQVETDCGTPPGIGFGLSTLFSTNCPNTVCPAGALVEAEACGSDLNGGCFMPVPAYDPIACGDTICGTAWADANFRDIDWYSFTLTQPSSVTWTVDADFPALIGFVDPSLGCAAPQFFGVATSTGECAQAVAVDNLAAGTWWAVVMTQGFSGYPCGSGRNKYVASLNCTPVVVADNDDCATAMMLTQQATCNPTADSVSNATQSLAGCAGTANDDVWFSFVATSTNPIVEVVGSTGFDAVVQVFSACGGTSLVCEDATLAGDAEIAPLTGLTIGNTYYVRVYDWFSGIPTTTGFTICVYDTPPPPVNDDCSGAIALGCNETISGNTTFATAEAANVGACGTGITAPGVWYTVTGNGGPITASLCTGTTYDSKINVYSGDCANLACVAGNDDACGLQSSITWNSLAGQTYYILVQGFGGNVGAFTLSISHQVTVPVVTTSGNTTFCQGLSVDLTSDVSGVVWSNSQTSQSINVTQSGDYFATLTDAAGCVGTSDTTTVDVLPTPATPVITASGSTTFCNGSSVTFTSSYLTGNTWSNGDTSNAIVANAAGTYSVTYTAANGCTASSLPVSVTVNPNPPTPVAVPQGSTSICPGSSIDITSSIASGITWSNGSSNQTITVNTPGCYSVTVTDANNCTSVSLPVCVTVLPAPVPTVTPNGNLNICGGSSIDLVASATGATFTWNGGQSGSTLTVSQSGDYFVTATYANGCTAVSDTVSLNLFPAATTPVITPSGNTTFCQGGSVDLNASPGVSFVWSNSASGSSITANASGTFTVTATDANGCTAVSQPVQVVVNPNPSVSIAANGPTTFCQGGALTITSSASVGNLWSNGESTQAIIVTTSGNYSSIVTDVNGCTATSNTVAVTVDSVPGALITSNGPLSVCNGGSVTLNANPSNAASYLWSNFNTGSTLNVTLAGTYFVTITGANGCSSVSPSVTVVSGSVNVPFITAGGPTIICEGQTVTLLSSSPTGNVWNTGETTESIDADSTGNYFVTVTDANGCSATSALVQVIVNPLPTASFTANAQVGGLVTFTNTSTSFVSSQWDFGDNSPLSNATNPAHTYASDGNYVVVLTVFNNCGTSTITQDVNIIGTGIDDLEPGQTFTVFPNPSSGVFNLAFEGNSNLNFRAQITDASGRLIWTDATETPSLSYNRQLNLDGLAKGVYFLRIHAGERSVSRKIMIQ